MTREGLLPLLPSLPLLVAAVVCLILEAAGAPPGARKQGERRHLAWLVALAGAISLGLAVDQGPFWQPTAMVALSLGLAAISVGAFVGEIGTLLCLSAVGFQVAGLADSPIQLWSGLLLGLVAGLGVAGHHEARAEEARAEAATKWLLAGGTALILGGLGAAIALGAGQPTLMSLADDPSLTALVAILLWALALAVLAGIAPLHALVVDFTSGAPLAAAVVVPSSIVVAGHAFATVVPAALGDAFWAAAVLCLIGLPLAALDQVQVSRVLGYLAVSQTGLVAAAVVAGSTERILQAAGAAAVGSIALLAARRALPRLDAMATWEDASGLGRQQPVRAGLLIFAAAAAAGLPATVGFTVRMDLARTLAQTGSPLLAVAVLAGAALAAAPLVRLALFLFAKEPRTAPEPRAWSAAIALAIAVAVSFVSSLVPLFTKAG